MSKITITVDMNDEEKMSKAIAFLSELNGGPTEVAEATQEEETEEGKPKKEKSDKAKKEEPANETKTKKVEEPETEEEEAPAKKAKSSITIDDLRPMITELVEKHRAALKSKLTKLGATSVTTLAEENYEEFYEFMKTL